MRAAYPLKDREAWVGWSAPQRRRRLALLANNSRFAILPGVDCPNLATRVLALNLARLSVDWERAYGHPILAVESFGDSQLFRGTCYRAQGWSLLGQTQGFGRHAEDYYTAHERPKQLWVRELAAAARATLRAAALPLALQPVEDKVLPRAAVPSKALSALVERCRAGPDWRGTKGRDYPLAGLLAMIVLAMLCGVGRGQRDLAAFASGLSQAQLRALLCRKGRNGRYQSPKETTFYRILTTVEAALYGQVLRAWAEASLGPGADLLVAIDGKAQCGSTPHCPDEQKAQLVGAVSFPSGRSLSCEWVEAKSNEIPAARQGLGPLDGKIVALDALHPNQETLRIITQDNGADFLLPVKANHAALQQAAAQSFPALTSGASPPPLRGCRRSRALPPPLKKVIAAAKKCANCAGWARRGKRSAAWGPVGHGNDPRDRNPQRQGQGQPRNSLLREQSADGAGERDGPAALDSQLLGHRGRAPLSGSMSRRWKTPTVSATATACASSAKCAGS